MSNVVCKVVFGDCLEVIPTLGEFNFGFADPPYNIGQKYKTYSDKLPKAEYQKFTAKWIETCWNALTSTGILALHGNDTLAELYLQNARALGMSRIAWINWHYRFGQCGRGNWIDSRCHCLIYARNPKNYTWNPESVLVESDRSSTYGDKRIHETARGGQRVPFTTWGVGIDPDESLWLPGTVFGTKHDGPHLGRVQGNNKERVPGMPNQLPTRYLSRLIQAYTNPGDNILDPFCGSGTTAVTAKALDRNCITIDICPATCKDARQRLRTGIVHL